MEKFVSKIRSSRRLEWTFRKIAYFEIAIMESNLIRKNMNKSVLIEIKKETFRLIYSVEDVIMIVWLVAWEFESG